MSSPKIEISALFEIMRAEQLYYYEIKTLDGRNTLAKNYENDNVEQSIEKLEKLMQSLSGANVMAIVRNTVKTAGRHSEKDRVYTYEINLSSNGEQNAGFGSERGNVTSLRDQIESLKLQILEDRYKQQLEDLKRDLQPSRRDPAEFIKELRAMMREQAMMKKTGKPAAKKPQSAAIGSAGWKQALIEFSKADADYIDELRALTKLAKEDPESYEQYKEILVSKYG